MRSNPWVCRWTSVHETPPASPRSDVLRHRPLRVRRHEMRLLIQVARMSLDNVDDCTPRDSASAISARLSPRRAIHVVPMIEAAVHNMVREAEIAAVVRAAKAAGV